MALERAHKDSEMDIMKLLLSVELPIWMPEQADEEQFMWDGCEAGGVCPSDDTLRQVLFWTPSNPSQPTPTPTSCSCVHVAWAWRSWPRRCWRCRGRSGWTCKRMTTGRYRRLYRMATWIVYVYMFPAPFTVEDFCICPEFVTMACEAGHEFELDSFFDNLLVMACENNNIDGVRILLEHMSAQQ